MVTENQIRKALRTLAADLRKRGEPDPESSFMDKMVPPHLHSLVPEAPRHCGDRSLHLSGQTYWNYRQALELLLTHRRNRYLSNPKADRELEDQFWSLCCELALDDSYRSTATQNSRIKAFMDSVRLPDREYEAIVQIQGISIPRRTLMGDVELVRGSPTLLREWDRWSGPLRPPWRGQTVARLTVTAGTIDAARRYALDRISMTCDELRISFPAIILTRIADEQVAFKTGWNALRGNGSTLYQPSLRHGKPVRWDHTFDASIEFLLPVYDLRATARTSIQKRADLAIRWFGMSWNAGTPWAMRIVGLFSGLEALLIKGESEPRKGALLAVRNALLSIAVEGHFINPEIAFSLYYLRSQLVHGARTTAEETHFHRTFSLAAEALKNYACVANRDANIRKHSKLLDRIADTQVLDRLKGWVEYYRPWGYEELLKEIEKMLGRGAV